MQKVIVIEPKDTKEMAFWKDIISRLNAKSSLLSIDELEDINLGLLMKREETGKLCSKKTILGKLKK